MQENQLLLRKHVINNYSLVNCNIRRKIMLLWGCVQKYTLIGLFMVCISWKNEESTHSEPKLYILFLLYRHKVFFMSGSELKDFINWGKEGKRVEKYQSGGPSKNKSIENTPFLTALLLLILFYIKKYCFWYFCNL